MEIWDKVKNVFTGEHRKFAWFVLVVLVIFVFSWMFGRGNTIFHWVSAKREIRRQEAQIEEYKRQIEEMDGSIDQRVTDIDTLEKFAREQYRFSEEGEDVYVIEKR
ncbi:MAG: septum formation initiator family protein [Bacteroidales bacterium]|nr:septum formation initiator family protein [Bacteroidales bacterium]MBR5861802.1 septum formation initiator family protein [Bacteroidales bacterium]